MVWHEYQQDQDGRIHYNLNTEIFYRYYLGRENQQISELTNQYIHLQKFRGQAINDSLSVEYHLEEMIKFFFLEVDFYKWVLFEEFIFSNHSFGFMEKKKTVEKILKSRQDELNLTKKEISNLMQLLMNIINDRNKFAHGKLVLDFQKEKIYLRYFENGPKELEISNDYYDTYFNNISSFNQQFGEILKNLIDITPY